MMENVIRPVHLSTLKRYISERIGRSALVFWKLARQGKVVIDRIPSFGVR